MCAHTCLCAYTYLCILYISMFVYKCTCLCTKSYTQRATGRWNRQRENQKSNRSMELSWTDGVAARTSGGSSGAEGTPEGACGRAGSGVFAPVANMYTATNRRLVPRRYFTTDLHLPFSLSFVPFQLVLSFTPERIHLSVPLDLRIFSLVPVYRRVSFSGFRSLRRSRKKKEKKNEK